MSEVKDVHKVTICKGHHALRIDQVVQTEHELKVPVTKVSNATQTESPRTRASQTYEPNGIFQKPPAKGQIYDYVTTRFREYLDLLNKGIVE